MFNTPWEDEMFNTPLAILMATTIVLWPITSSLSSSTKLTVPQPQARYSYHEPTNKMLKCMKDCGERYGVKPEVILAVAKIEGQDLKDGLIRLGPIGKGTYYGPMGIFRGFKVAPYYWNIDDPFVNVEVGARALRGNLNRKLRRYNEKFTKRYYNEIVSLSKKYEREKVFERSDNKMMFKFTTQQTATLLKAK
jgi:hypothetical protein